MKLLAPFILIFVIAASAFGQESIAETQKIDEFGRIFCCDFGARVDLARITQSENPSARIFIVYYGARKHEVSRRDRLGREKKVLINPMRNEFRDFQRGFQKRAMFQKVDITNFVFINGGYRERMSIEIWLVPPGSEPPKTSPTIDEKTIRFRKGIPGYFAGICDGV